MADTTTRPALPAAGDSSGDEGFPGLVSDLWQLTLGYFKQETLDPLKSLGRFLGFGAAGAVTLGIGLVLMLLGGLRLLQVQTRSVFDGNWSWATYAIAAAACGVFVALAMLFRARKPSRGLERTPKT